VRSAAIAPLETAGAAGMPIPATESDFDFTFAFPEQPPATIP
jgi:hypothetical protein